MRPPNAAGRPPGTTPDDRPNAEHPDTGTITAASITRQAAIPEGCPGQAMDRLRVALEEHGCQPHGSGIRLRARCPVHESHGLTLAVSQGRSGALIKCHAQCETGDVLAALGLTWDDTFDAPRDRTPDWRPRPRPAGDPMAELRQVLTRAVGVINLRAAMDAYRECCPMPSLSADERVKLAEWCEERDQDAHYWRTLARWAALATDEATVRRAYADRDAGRLTHEQTCVLAVRAEDLTAARVGEAA